MSDYPKTLVVIRDCHAKNNQIVTAHSEDDERLYRKMAAKKGWKVAVRKDKPKQVCDNCDSMELRNVRGAVGRYCSLYGQWIPDGDKQHGCDHHSSLNGAFLLHLTQLKKEGGAR